MRKRLLAELVQPRKKSIVVIAGANGSGKSTLVEGLELKYRFAHIDPDKMARSVAKRTAAARAGRKSILLRKALFREGATFGIETTLSGKTLNKFFRESKAAGYRIVIVYTWLDNPQLCIERIGVRVAAGGHHVEDADVTRRFYRSNLNFWNVSRLIADQWFLFYNGHKEAKLVAVGTRDRYDVRSNDLFERYGGLIDDCEHQINSKRAHRDLL
jgi:predicted ABC-type ATPase